MTDTQTPRRRRRKPDREKELEDFQEGLPPQAPGTALALAEKSAIADTKTARLKELEGIIREELPGHIQSSISIGAALREIKEDELFKPYFNTWDDYITDQWHLSRSYTYQLIDAAKIVGDIQRSLDTLGTSAIADTVLLTIVGNEWRARQLKGREAAVVRRIQKGEDPQEAVDSEIAKAKRERDKKAIQRQAQKDVTARAAVDANGQPVDQEQDHPDTDDDGFIRLTNGSGKVKYGTPRPDGHLLIGTDKGGERLGADQEVAPDLTRDLAMMVRLLNAMDIDAARKVLRPHRSALLRILG
jgi:hypothetical protein